MCIELWLQFNPTSINICTVTINRNDEVVIHNIVKAASNR